MDLVLFVLSSVTYRTKIDLLKSLSGFFKICGLRVNLDVWYKKWKTVSENERGIRVTSSVFSVFMEFFKKFFWMVFLAF
jgi:hypothetical protein